MDRRSSLSNRFSLSTSNISSPVAESTRVNGFSSSLQSKFPWGGKMNSSQMSPNTTQRSVQKIPVSPLKIGLIDPRVYTDAQSKGLASRVVKYHENSKKVNRSLSVGNLYNKPGQFPVVHLKKTELHCSNRRNKDISMVKIAPPEKSVFQANTRTSILRTGSVVPTVYLHRADEKNSRENEPILLPAENDLTPTRSVLDALKEISRKRINNDDLDDTTDGIKKYCKESDGTSVSYNSEYNPNVGKRQRETPTSPNSKKNSIEQVLKKRMCTKNNDITSSLSSSLTINTPKRKLCEINKGGKFSERLSPSDISVPPHAKQPCNEINKVFKETAISSSFVEDAITPLPPTPQAETALYKPVTKTVSVPAILNNTQKPKLTLFNKDYGDVSLLKAKSEIIQPHNSAKSDDEEDGLVGISFVKPRKKSPLLSGNNEALKRVRESKLSLMLSCLSGDPQEETDDVDSADPLNTGEKEKANSKGSIEYTPLLPKYNEPKADIQLNGFTNTVVSSAAATKTSESTAPLTSSTTTETNKTSNIFARSTALNTSITFSASTTPLTSSTTTETNKTSNTLAKSPISTSGFTFAKTETGILSSTTEKTTAVTSTTAAVVIPTSITTSSNVLQMGNSNFTFGKPSELTPKSDNTANSTEKTSLLTPITSTSPSLLKPITSGGFSFGIKPAVSTISPPSFGESVSNTTTSNIVNVSHTGDTTKIQPSEVWFGRINPVSTAVATSTSPASQTVSLPEANSQVPVFGASLSSSAPIMSTSIFSQTSSTSAFNPVAPSTKIQPETTSISFSGKTTSPVFGSQSATTPVFGSQSATTPVFGSQTTTNPVFGSETTTSPVFGSQSTPVFGSNSQNISTPVFGSGTSVGNSFHTMPNQQQPPAFGTAPTQQLTTPTPVSSFSNATPAFGTSNAVATTGFGSNQPSFGTLTGQTPNAPSTGSTSIFGNIQNSNSGFSFTANSATATTAKTNLFENKIAENPSSFSFGGSQLNSVTPTTTTIASASFNFAQPTTTTSSTSTFTATPFAFGAPATQTTSATVPTQSNSAFVFGSSAATNNKPDPNSSSYNFGNGTQQASSSGFGFGSSTNNSNNNNNTAVVKPTPFGFGNTNNSANTDLLQQQNQNTPFAFNSQNASSQKPGGFAFNLSGVPENKNPFGAPSSSTPNQSQVAPVSNQNTQFSNSFSFGGGSSTNDPKPAVPSFFGGANNNNNTSNPTFGTLAAGNTNNQSKPFAFGGAGNTSTNLFGGSTSNNNNNNNNVVSPFGGNTSAINQNQNSGSAQPFSFGSNMTSPQGNSASNSSPFAFGGSSTATKSEQTNKPFNFSKQQQQPPANLFASPPAQPAFNFVAGNPNTDPNNGFNTQPTPTNLFAVGPTTGTPSNARRPIRIANRRLNK